MMYLLAITLLDDLDFDLKKIIDEKIGISFSKNYKYVK